MADVYLALDERLASAAEDAAARCAVEDALERRMAGIMEEAEAGLLARLATVSITAAREPIV